MEGKKSVLWGLLIAVLLILAIPSLFERSVKRVLRDADSITVRYSVKSPAFILTDDKGKAVAWLQTAGPGEPYLQLRSGNGSMVNIRVSDRDGGGIAILDENTNTVWFADKADRRPNKASHATSEPAP
jgi:hypothetical protein